LQSKVEEANASDLSWTKRFGAIAFTLDLKMIWRNKRPKTTIWMSLIILFYGLIVYINPAYKDTPVFCVCWNFNDWSIYVELWAICSCLGQ
jgi:hypothetical protein